MTQFGNFSTADAVVTITATNIMETDYVIDYVYLENSIPSTSGYSLIVQNGYITQIRDNTISTTSIRSVESSSSTSTLTTAIIQSATNQAIEAVEGLNPEYTIAEQHSNMFYDAHEGRYYYKTKSVYVTPTGGYGAIVTLYEL